MASDVKESVNQEYEPAPINISLLCPKCNKKKIIVLSDFEENDINLKLECLTCEKITKISLDDYMKFLSNNHINYNMCQKIGGAHKDIPALKYCCDCKRFFCNECCNIHDSFIGGHKFLDINKANLPNICPTHFKLSTFYCINCQKVLCDDCNIEEHKNSNHKIYDFKDLSKNLKKNIDDFENFITKDLREKKDKIVRHLKGLIKDIEDDYLKFLNKNKKFLTFLKIVLNSYPNIKYISNINNNFKLNVKLDLKVNKNTVFDCYNALEKYFKSTIPFYNCNYWICPLDFNKVIETKNYKSNISIGNNQTHDGGAIFDDRRRIMVSTSGNYNNGKNLKLTSINDDKKNINGQTKLYEHVIPFSTHGSYPIFDGEKFIYFFESESGNNNRFGRINIDEIPDNFTELQSIPNKFKEYSSAVFHFGKIFVENEYNEIWVYDIEVSNIIYIKFLLNYFYFF